MNRDLAFFTVRSLPEGGKGEAVDVADRVTSFVVEEEIKGADKLELTVLNVNLENFDDMVWRKGNILEVQWGYPGNVSLPEQFIIRKITGFLMLKVVAHSKGVLMNRVPHTRIFDAAKRSDIATKIAKEYGYGDELIHVQDTKVKHRHITQGKLTDAQLLRKMALREGYEFYVDATGFHFHRRNLGQKPVKELTYFMSGTGDLNDVDVENDITAMPGKVTASGVDPLNKKKLTSSADKSTARDGLAGVLEVIDPVTGETSLQSRVAQSELVHSTETDGAAVKAQAEARFRDHQANAVKLSCTAVGDPQLRKGRVVQINGISKRLSGKYYIKSTTHTIEGGGYTTSFHAATDGSAGYSDGKDVKTDASLNKQRADGSASGVQQFEKIDSVTGESKIVWRPVPIETPPGK